MKPVKSANATKEKKAAQIEKSPVAEVKATVK